MGYTRQKIDVFIDTEPGHFFELKFIRPIPSRATRPFPQHRGSLIADLLRLSSLQKDGIKNLLLVADIPFVRHLVKKPGFPMITGEKWEGIASNLITVKTERNQVRGYMKFLNTNLRIKAFDDYPIGDHIYSLLWRIETIS